MKKRVFSSVAAVVFMAFAFLHTQSQVCPDLSVVSAGPDTVNQNVFLIHIHFDGEPGQFLNYPYVSSLFDCNGEEIGAGSMFIFGQFSESAVAHPVTLSGSTDCLPLTAVFVYMNNMGETDTCYLSIGDTGMAIDNRINRSSLAFPNPFEGELHLQTNLENIDSAYDLMDGSGRSVLSGTIRSELTTFDTDHLVPGIYFIRFGPQMRQVITVMKR
jgi:hypothetical protein